MEWSRGPQSDRSHFLTMMDPCVDSVGCGFQSGGKFMCEYGSRSCREDAPLFSGTECAWAKGNFSRNTIEDLYGKMEGQTLVNATRARAMLDSARPPCARTEVELPCVKWKFNG